MIKSNPVLTRLLSLALMGTLAAFARSAAADEPKPETPQTLSWEGKEGPGKGKQIVLIAGANEYNPEVGLPILGRILAEHHGFTCTVLFTQNKKTGEIDPNTSDNLPGLEALDHADLMIILCRFRALPDDQMKHIVDYLEAGKPVIGMRTATHSFQYPKDTQSAYKKYTHNSKDPGFDGGFGRQVLGETWINHLGPNATTSTRGIFAAGAAGDPILRGIADGEIFGATGVYAVRLPLLPNCKTLLLGQVTEGKTPEGRALDTLLVGKPAQGKKQAEIKPNDPMMPVAWTRTYSLVDGKTGRVFTTTMGSAADLQNEAMRRLMVNAAYWAVGLEEKIPAKADVTIGSSWPAYKKGMKPSDLR